MAKIFDAHAHYDDSAFDNDRDKLLQSMASLGVEKIVNGGTNLSTSAWGIEYSKRYPFFYTTVGIHPECLDDLPKDYLQQIERMLKNNKAVAIGEIGLDYYWKEIPRDKQYHVFEQQLILAKELNVPVVVHDRDAHGDTMDLLRKYKPKGLVHCFSGSVEMSREIVKLGMSISLGGVVTFKNARHSVDVAKEIPSDRLLLETDAPYMAPVPYRGKRCDSSMIDLTAAKIAEIRSTSKDSILDMCYQNACEFYHIQ